MLVGGQGRKARRSAIGSGIQRLSSTKFQRQSTPSQDAACLPLIQVRMIYSAHPTPGLTRMAAVGQFWAHAPHSIQPSRSRIAAFFPTLSKTPWGQTISHIPHPLHATVSSFSVDTPGRYRKVSIT